MNTKIEVIAHQDQRYETVGDWYYVDGDLHIRVSDLGDPRQNDLIEVHELVEAKLCKYAGVTQEDVDAFDNMFELERSQGLHDQADEPGDDCRAPYYLQHQIATGIERILAAQLGVDWNTYAKNVESQSNGKIYEQISNGPAGGPEALTGSAAQECLPTSTDLESGSKAP